MGLIVLVKVRRRGRGLRALRISTTVVILLLLCTPEMLNQAYAARIISDRHESLTVFIQSTSDIDKPISDASITTGYDPGTLDFGYLYVQTILTYKGGKAIPPGRLQLWVPAGAQIAGLEGLPNSVTVPGRSTARISVKYKWPGETVIAGSFRNMTIITAQIPGRTGPGVEDVDEIDTAILTYRLPVPIHSKDSFASARVRLDWDSSLGRAMNSVPDSKNLVDIRFCRECLKESATEPLETDVSTLLVKSVEYGTIDEAEVTFENPLWATLISAPAKWIFSTLLVASLITPLLVRLVRPPQTDGREAAARGAKAGVRKGSVARRPKTTSRKRVSAGKAAAKGKKAIPPKT